MRKYSRKQKKMQVENGATERQRRVRLPGGEVIINARAELLGIAIKTGLQAMQVMLKEDVERLCGPRYCHQKTRKAFRWGETTIESTLSTVRDVSRNVKRWQNGGMALRWTVTGLIEAEKHLKQSRTKVLPLLKSRTKVLPLLNLKEAA